MIHISQYVEGSTILHIHLEGALDREHVVAMSEVVREAEQRQIPNLVLHCGGLLSIDDSGKTFLADLKSRGARLLDLPITVSWRLHASEHTLREEHEQ
jgi:anti-anti-sigma regulatory factor